MSRKRQRSVQERRLLEAREVDRTLRKERANRLEERAERVRKFHSQTGWALYRVGAVSLLLLPTAKGILCLGVLAPSAGFLALYLWLGFQLRKLERERDFYGWVPDNWVIPSDWKSM